MSMSKEERKKKLESIDIEKLKAEISEEEVFNIVFNDEKLTELCFDFIGDFLDDIDDEDDIDIDAIYANICNNYIEIARLHDIYLPYSFKFPDYSDSRTICIDGKCYELEELIANDDDELKQKCKEFLYEIDAICADLPDELETTLKRVEEHINENLIFD